MDPFCHNRRYRYINTSVFFSLFPFRALASCTAYCVAQNTNAKANTKAKAQNGKIKKLPYKYTKRKSSFFQKSYRSPDKSDKKRGLFFSQSSFPKTDNYTANIRNVRKTNEFISSLKCDLRSVKIVEKIFRKRFVIEQSIKKLWSHKT